MRKKLFYILFAALCICLLGSLSAQALTRDEAVNWAKMQANNGTAYDVDGIYGYQCSDFGTAYINYLITGNPYSKTYTTYMGYKYFDLSYPSGWQRIANTADFVPQPGDILCFAGNSSNSAGHVAVATEGCTVSVIKGIGQNGHSNGGNGTPAQYQTMQYFGAWGNFQGVIRPKFDDELPPAKNPWINTNKYTVKIGEEITFNYGADNATQYILGIDKIGIGRVRTVECGGASVYSTIFNETGEYSIFATCCSEGGSCDSVRIAFTVVASLPEDFYAVVYNRTKDRTLTNTEEIAVSEKYIEKRSQIWRFMRSEQGSYKIYSQYDNKLLGVDGDVSVYGAKAVVQDDNGSPTQRWHLGLNADGSYYLQNAGNMLVNLDCNYGGYSHTWEGHPDWVNQQYFIDIVYKPTQSSISVTPGSNLSDTLISWTNSERADKYHVRIYSGGISTGNEEFTLWNITGNNAAIRLAPGKYEAYIDSENTVGWTSGANIVAFEVTEFPVADIGNERYAKIEFDEFNKYLTCDDNNATIYDGNSLGNQVWNFTRQSNGAYKILNVDTGLALSVDDKVENVVMEPKESKDSQLWNIYLIDNGHYVFMPISSKIVCLEVAGHVNKNGAAVSLYNSTTASKLFKIIDAENPVITYDANGGTGVPSSQTKVYGKDLALSNITPTRMGYIFKGWNTKADGSGANYSAGEMYSANAAVKLFATWRANDYTVRYDSNGGSGKMSDSAHRYDAEKALSKNTFTKPYCRFKGWNTAPDGSGTAYADGASVKNLAAENGGVVTLYAQWERTVYTESVLKEYSGYSQLSVKLHGITAPARVIVAAYRRGRLMNAESREVTSSAEIFALLRDFDTVKVMVWDGESGMKPLTEAEIVKK